MHLRYTKSTRGCEHVPRGKPPLYLGYKDDVEGVDDNEGVSETTAPPPKPYLNDNAIAKGRVAIHLLYFGMNLL